MFDRIWAILIVFSLIFAFLRGRANEAADILLEGAGNAVSLVIRLSAGYAFFSGLMEAVGALGALKALSALLSPLLQKLFPLIQNSDTKKAIIENFSANMLGLGNAATPAGIEAMRLLKRDGGDSPYATRAMCLFLVINATSLQLLPTTVIALRAAAGSASPGAVILPTMLSTAVSTIVGALLCKLCERFYS